MAELLRRIAAESDPRSNRFMNGARARLAEAIVRLEEGERRLREMWVYPRSRAWTELRMLQAIAHLRRGEEDNCVMHHDASSCLFPILPAGVHGQKRGSQEAVAILTSILRQSPGHLQARWLLNIAHMTLGAYPALVPREWLLPPGLFDSEGDIGRFTDVAAAAVLDVDDLAGGSVTDDFDGDGYLDVMVSSMGLESQLRYFHSGADGTFTERTDKAGLTGLVGGLNVVQSDYDNDGWEDIFVSGYYIADPGDIAADYLGLPHGGEFPRLYRNNSDGTFADVTRAAGLRRVLFSMGSNYGDLDNDGWLDFYVGTGSPGLGMLMPNRVFRNDEGRSFQDVTTSAGLSHLQKGHGVSFADLDNDGDQDIHQVVGGAFEADHFRNALYQNPGHGKRWITLTLQGVRSNRPAIGARIEVVVRTKAGSRSIHRTVRSGGSFGASPLRQEIGLGDAEGIERVEIFWPSGGIRQVVKGLELNRRYHVTEGEEQASPIQLESFRLGRKNPDSIAPSGGQRE